MYVELPPTQAAQPSRESVQYQREKEHHRKANDMDSILATIVAEPGEGEDLDNLRHIQRETTQGDEFYRVETETDQ